LNKQINIAPPYIYHQSDNVVLIDMTGFSVFTISFSKW